MPLWRCAALPVQGRLAACNVSCGSGVTGRAQKPHQAAARYQFCCSELRKNLRFYQGAPAFPIRIYCDLLRFGGSGPTAGIPKHKKTCGFIGFREPGRTSTMQSTVIYRGFGRPLQQT
jgi:hypothetical protein